jgi:hypothetical protein
MLAGRLPRLVYYSGKGAMPAAEQSGSVDAQDVSSLSLLRQLPACVHATEFGHGAGERGVEEQIAQ